MINAGAGITKETMSGSSYRYVHWIPILMVACVLSRVTLSGQSTRQQPASTAVVQEGIIKLTDSINDVSSSKRRCASKILASASPIERAS